MLCMVVFFLRLHFCSFCIFFFFFKQKTAYEMRISDWSSDVCSSDLKQDPARAAKMQPIFITIDPQRDTPQVLKNYVSAFHPKLIGDRKSVVRERVCQYV